MFSVGAATAVRLLKPPELASPATATWGQYQETIAWFHLKCCLAGKALATEKKKEK